MDISILEDLNFDVQVEWWVKPSMSFLPQQPSERHLETIKFNQQGESSHASLSLILLCPASQVCGAFSRRVLRTTCRGKPTWKWSVLFCSPLVPPWPMIHREVLGFAIFIYKHMSSRSVIVYHAGCFLSSSFLKYIILSFNFGEFPAWLWCILITFSLPPISQLLLSPPPLPNYLTNSCPHMYPTESSLWSAYVHSMWLSTERQLIYQEPHL